MRPGAGNWPEVRQKGASAATQRSCRGSAGLWQRWGSRSLEQRLKRSHSGSRPAQECCRRDRRRRSELFAGHRPTADPSSCCPSWRISPHPGSLAAHALASSCLSRPGSERSVSAARTSPCRHKPSHRRRRLLLPARRQSAYSVGGVAADRLRDRSRRHHPGPAYWPGPAEYWPGAAGTTAQPGTAGRTAAGRQGDRLPGAPSWDRWGRRRTAAAIAAAQRRAGAKVPRLGTACKRRGHNHAGRSAAAGATAAAPGLTTRVGPSGARRSGRHQGAADRPGTADAKVAELVSAARRAGHRSRRPARMAAPLPAGPPGPAAAAVRSAGCHTRSGYHSAGLASRAMGPAASAVPHTGLADRQGRCWECQPEAPVTPSVASAVRAGRPYSETRAEADSRSPDSPGFDSWGSDIPDWTAPDRPAPDCRNSLPDSRRSAGRLAGTRAAHSPGWVDPVAIERDMAGLAAGDRAVPAQSQDDAAAAEVPGFVLGPADRTDRPGNRAAKLAVAPAVRSIATSYFDPLPDPGTRIFRAPNRPDSETSLSHRIGGMHPEHTQSCR